MRLHVFHVAQEGLADEGGINCGNGYGTVLRLCERILLHLARRLNVIGMQRKTRREIVCLKRKSKSMLLSQTAFRNSKISNIINPKTTIIIDESRDGKQLQPIQD